MGRVAVIGSLVVDMAMRTPRLPSRGDNIHTDSFRMGAGGKGGNAAAALTRLGHQALVVGCVGDDALGRFQLAALQAERVDIAGITIVADAPTAALIAATLEGHSWRDAVRRANGAGALATTRFGTLDAMPTGAELDAILASRPPPPG